MRAHYEYGPRGDQPAVTLTWYQGAEKPELWTNRTIPQWPSGVLFVGDKGMLLSDYEQAPAAARGQVQGLHAAAADDPEVARASRGVDSRLQDRRADDVPLRVRRDG